MEDQDKRSEFQLKVAFWIGFAIGVFVSFLAVIGVGAITTVAGAF